MNVRDIVEKYLRDNGYDGLYEDEGAYASEVCCCTLDDLMRCGNVGQQCECVAGYCKPYSCGTEGGYIWAQTREELEAREEE